ncbi:hypothetical protein F4780DRAFT_771387 [Xylariomycetidae sp. FL0641]|nr:hypothetical protein F4780DRAFT_771387 [Xylariomycetidae sp. FL0641]
MAIPMILALSICPAMLGTQEAIRQSQSKNKREEHRARRCNLVVSCVKQSIRSRDINGKLVVLKDNKLYITTSSSTSDEEPIPTSEGYPFSGYYLPYPDSEYEGIVSTISDDPPMLNWIYVDKDTYEVKYGVRAFAQDNITGPFDCTRQDRRMTLEGWEGFVAVEEFPGVWALYFDRDDDGLATKVPMGTRVLEVELTRREKKERKPEPDIPQAQTLDEMMAQHKEQTRREEEERQAFIQKQQEEAEAHGIATSQLPAEQDTGTVASSFEPPTDAAAAADVERLSISTDARTDLQVQSTSIVASPSVTATDSLSVWSAAGRNGEEEDLRSVTAASSIVPGRIDAGAAGEREKEPSKYKRPYVEDGGQDEEQEATASTT